MNYVLFVVAHGVELKPVGKDYASPLIERIRARLTDEERGFLIAAPYNYSVKTNERQRAMFESTDRGLGNERLRYLKHTVGSDVTWSFITAKDGKECFYRDFVDDLSAVIDSYRKQWPDIKVVCAGHSQGSQLFYSFFFDYPAVVDLFASLGSPISMNSGAYDGGGRRAPNLRAWINFWHRMDFVSSKMQGCQEPFPQDVARFVVDYEVPSSWWKLLYKLPNWWVAFGAGIKAHVSYWESDLVADVLADEVRKLIKYS